MLNTNQSTISLEVVAAQFAEWRKLKGSAPKPVGLWRQVAKLDGHYKRGEIYKSLNISSHQYQRCLARFGASGDIELASKPQQSEPATLSFVQVPMPDEVVKHNDNSQLFTLEFKRSDGGVLSCQANGLSQARSLIAWFMGGC